MLYVGGYGPDAGLILRTARERGLDLQLVGGDGLGMDEFWAVAGERGEGTIFSGRWDVRDRPQAADLLARFRARGLGTRTLGVGAYAAVQVWAQAVERAGSLELADVAGTLLRGRFDTVVGRVAFDNKGDLLGAAWQWKVWTAGEYVPLDDSAVDQGPAGAPQLSPSRADVGPLRILGRPADRRAASERAPPAAHTARTRA